MSDLLARTAQLVAVASESHHERELTDLIEAELRDRAPWLVVDRVGDNLVARTMLSRPLRLVIAGHTDTVPINGNHPGHIDGDVLWGCGASDMKSGLAVMLELACTVERPAVDVSFVFYEAEEVAAVHNGLGRLFAERPDLVAGDVALLGEPTDAAIEAGCQGTMRVEVTYAGVRAHTARPWMGVNAIHRLGAALARLDSYESRQPTIEGCTYREAMQAVRVDGGVASNVVPDRATLTVNHRFAPDRTPAQAEASVRSLVLPDPRDGDMFTVVDVASAAAPAMGHPLLAALVSRHALEVRAKLGWTDVARFAAHGIPAANFGPGDPTLAHTKDERVHRAPIERTFAALDELVRRGP